MAAKKLFTSRPTAEELVQLALGEIEAEYLCDHCIKDCKKGSENWNLIWCVKFEQALINDL